MDREEYARIETAKIVERAERLTEPFIVEMAKLSSRFQSPVLVMTDDGTLAQELEWINPEAKALFDGYQAIIEDINASATRQIESIETELGYP